MTTISMQIDDDLSSSMKKRADKHFQTVSELCSDIVRRSMITYNKKTVPKTNDKLVQIFSRERRGRKKK